MNKLRFVFASATLVGALAAQNQLLLPDNHHLSEGLAKTPGTTNWWGTTAAGRRFQVLYEASHFTNSGVAGPIVINELAFRGEDCERNKGGQTYSNVTVDVYSTTLNTTTMNLTTFALNTAPSLPNASTLLGSTVLLSVVTGPSVGVAPNSYCVILPLGSLAPFDPTSGSQVNLIVDIKWTAYFAAPGVPPVPATPMIATQDTTGTTAQIRGRGIYATSSLATAGTASANPPVVRVGFAGSGGYASLIPARVESFGAACGGAPSAFYELHRHTQTYDLSGPGQVDGLNGLVLTPDTYPAPNFYTVTGGAAPVDIAGGVTGVADTTIDDATYPHALPGTFFYPGGSTATIRPATNGYIILDSTSTETVADYTCQVEEFIGSIATNAYARLAPCWHDFNPARNTVSNPGSGLYARNVGTVCLVTWYQVGSFDTITGDNVKHTLQCAIDTATGVVQFRYGPMDPIGGDPQADAVPSPLGDYISVMTGFTRGRIGGTTASADPQSRDLSIERPFTTNVEGGTNNMGLTAVSTPAPAPAHYPGRMYGGQSITWNAIDVPAGSVIGVLLLDGVTTRPGLQFPGITAPGCMLSTGTGALLIQITVLPPPTVVGTVPLVVPGGYNPGILGAVITAQYVVLDGLLGGPNLITVASNALLHTVGLQ